MPNKKDTILIDGKEVAKRYLRSTKLELYKKFRKENQEFKRKFVTFLSTFSRNYKKNLILSAEEFVCAQSVTM